MTRATNYDVVLAFRTPKWVRQALDDMRGPGEDRSDVLRKIVIPAVSDPGEDSEEE